MATPHISAEKGDFADIVLMPGDPLRAKMIAETYLDGSVQVTGVRGMLGFTGTYKGKRISVMGSGMGMPSMGIYSYELFSYYGVEKILRIGSAGSYVPELRLGDVVLEESAFSESSYALVQSGRAEQVIFPSQRLNETIRKTADGLGIPLVPASVHSTDVFYCSGSPDYYKSVVAEHGCSCVEMESFALFHNAEELGKEAACLLTISDSFVSEQAMSAEERQNTFQKMITVALEAACQD